MSVTIKVNGIEIEAPDGAWLIDVCRDNGIEIPNFCYHPGLGPDGNCRMCQVEFVTQRGNRLGISCNAVVVEGMEVNTESAPALRARASVEEFLLLNHPLDCPICDKAGECSLQDYYMSHDLENSRQNFTRFRENKAMDIGPTLILDQERCVLCDRCVRFLRDVAGEEQLFIAGRGHEAYITTFPGKEVTSPYSLNTVDLCPVGALTAKDFRFASATWFLKNTPSVCTTCARGCSMQLQVHRNFTDKAGEHRDRVMRFRPRHNPEVNGYWACDEGRLNYRFVNEGRIDAPFVRIGGEIFVASQEEALAEFRQILGFSRTGGNERTDKMNVVLLASAHATLEEMFLLKRLAGRLDASVFVARHCADGEDDALLRRADRHPNAMGAERLGIDVLNLQRPGEGDEAVRKHLGEGGVLVCVGFNVEISDAVVALASSALKVVALSACVSQLTSQAELVIPGLTFAEKDGLIVNFEGQVQRLRAAVHGRAVSEWKILVDLLASIGDGEAVEFVSHVRKAIGETEPAFAGVDLVNVGAFGVTSSGQPVG